MRQRVPWLGDAAHQARARQAVPLQEIGPLHFVFSYQCAVFSVHSLLNRKAGEIRHDRQLHYNSNNHGGIMKLSRLLCAALLVIAPFAHALNHDDMAAYAQVYKGPEQLKVTILHNKADDHALVWVEGINHPFDRRIFWTDIQRQTVGTARDPGQNVQYEASPDGKEEKRVLFSIAESVSPTEILLYLPNWRGQTRAKIDLSYNSQASRSIDTANFINEYNRQLKGKK
jgi:hypothetical protein